MMKTTLNNLQKHLAKCSPTFVPQLDSYVDIKEYSKKIYDNAVAFTKFDDNELVGLVAAYNNPKEKFGWITNVSVDPEYSKRGIASKLLHQCYEYFKNLNYHNIFLEVFCDNEKAINLYRKNGFILHELKGNKMIMKQQLMRNYDTELNDTADHKYAYGFDFDVMHPYYLKASLPYIDVNGSCLELGSSKGHFTKRLLEHFSHITCVEASTLAIKEAKERLNDPDSVNFVHDLFEDVTLNSHKTIFLTHVLEHIENPVELLKKINNNWLDANGTLILICPNANAPSRQIAVKMGLISHNTAVTPAEAAHGHHITYTLDTLERVAQNAGLDVVYRTGIFFKALANLQWDEILKTNIISKEYLDGCYALGQQYPDLCSSIMIVCKKG